MLKIKKITLIYTNICNISCRHCFWGKTTKPNRLSNVLMDSILSSCAENGIGSICISGGEPMLFFDEFKGIIEKHKSSFQTVGICSNGFWGDTQEKAEYYMASFKQIGMNLIELSYDVFHAEFISISAIINIINAAKRFEIEVQIIVCAIKNEYLAIVGKLSRLIPLKNITIQHVGRFGNAINITENLKIACNVKICNQFLSHPSIDYEGRVYYCCGAYVTEKENSNFLFERFNKSTLTKLAANDSLYQSFKNIWDENCKHADNYQSLCEYCKACLLLTRIV